jgi:hypothetical protein
MLANLQVVGFVTIVSLHVVVYGNIVVVVGAAAAAVKMDCLHRDGTVPLHINDNLSRFVFLHWFA